MDILLNVLEALGVDKTIFAQFGIFVFVFIVLKKLLFETVLDVLREREEKTVITEKNSDELMNEVAKLEQQYNATVAEIYQKYQNKFSEDKKEIMQEEDKRFKMHEKEILEKEEIELEKINTELEQLRNEVFAHKDSLKQELMSKLS